MTDRAIDDFEDDSDYITQRAAAIQAERERRQARAQVFSLQGVRARTTTPFYKINEKNS